MADEKNVEKIIKIGLDTSSAEKSADSLSSKIANLSDEDFGVKSVKELKKQLDDSKKRLDDLKEDASKLDGDFEQAAAAVAKLESELEKVIDTNGKIDAKKIEQLQKAANSSAKSISKMEDVIDDIKHKGNDIFNEETSAKLKGRLEMIGGEFGILGEAIGATVGEGLKLTGMIGKMSTSINKGATAFKGLGLAMKTVIIFAVISAVALLIEKWDDIKAAIDRFMPTLTKQNGVFDKSIQVLQGVGNAILKYLSAPLKAIISLLQGDFKGAWDDFLSGWNVLENYQEGVTDALARQSADYRKKELERNIKFWERNRELLAAAGKDTKELDERLFKYKQELYADDQEKYEDLLFEKNKADAAAQKTANDKAKQAADKAKADRAAELAQYKEFQKEAVKFLEELGKSSRQKEIDDIKAQYKIRIDLAKKYGQDYSAIVKEQNELIKQLEIGYNKQISEYTGQLRDKDLDDFQKQSAALITTYTELLKNATEAQKPALKETYDYLVGLVDKAQEAAEKQKLIDTKKVRSEIEIQTTERNNTILETDSPETVKNKLQAVADVKLQALRDNYILEQELYAENTNKLLELEKNYNDAVYNVQQTRAENEKAIDEAAKEAKMNNILSVSDATSGLSQLFGEQTVAAKALNIATATMDTYVGANKALAQGGIFGIASAVGIIATGIANVKKIIGTKVAAAAATTSGIANTTVTAPVINSNVLPQQQTQDVRVVEQSTEKEQQPVRAYIVNSDLMKQSEKNATIDRLSSY